jgi:hypothetical protein
MSVQRSREMREQPGLVREEKVVTAIERIGLDERNVLAEQIAQSRYARTNGGATAIRCRDRSADRRPGF